MVRTEADVATVCLSPLLAHSFGSVLQLMIFPSRATAIGGAFRPFGFHPWATARKNRACFADFDGIQCRPMELIVPLAAILVAIGAVVYVLWSTEHPR